MKWLQVITSVALAGQLAIHAAPQDRDTAQSKAAPAALRSSEPSDSGVLKLPGAPVPLKRVAVPQSVPIAPQESVTAGAEVPVAAMPKPDPPPAKLPPVKSPPVKPVPAAVRRELPKLPAEGESHAVAKKPKPAVPPEFVNDSAVFCQKQIGHWKAADARSLLGQPLRQRPAYDDKKAVNGTIYAFSDPGRSRELELDFDKSTGNLRTVFSYPPQMTWKECLRLWGDKVASADAKQGRTFYSYLDRRLDVLVDQKGNVISLGLY